ncbi:hypothetical protein CIL05_02105 [Virgibacillus profundi]|uniref:CwlT-like lysozyme domain-containing protein n=1 Tax=Virgibacillus profundi TaxID=2024555 RepID=A0A2A2IJZ1_9BACI|nr:lysozyme family protein [Virgibacillus profundi]PAV31470.1 hypothetical protein CIL05_02105 [Virgibacillus profundi]PXY55656.1 lysozyme family protein [Virgibacillus profundi]
MKIKKKTKNAFKKTAVIIITICSIFVVVSFISYEKPDDNFKVSYPVISEEVENYRHIVEKYAKKFDVLAYENVLLAMMMQESGGRGNDPMQSSESYCGSRGCIDDPELSIKQGVYYFSKTLQDADDDLELAIQSYNFGRGFIDYVQGKSGKYTIEIAIDFSKEMYDKDPNKSKYRCLREGARELDACYGDIYYVRSVMEYREVLSGN